MNVLTEWTSFHSVEVVGVDTDDVRLRRRTKGKVAQKLFVVLFAVLDVAPRLRAGVGIDADHEDVVLQPSKCLGRRTSRRSTTT